MLVRSENVEAVKSAIISSKFVSVDTETFGLRPFHGDKPFSVIIAVETDVFYIPVQISAGVTGRDLIDIRDWCYVFSGKTVFLHNAKFDMHHLATIGFSFPPDACIHDTMVASRLCFSNEKSYSLDSCALLFLGVRKDDKAKKWLDDNQAYSMELKPGVQQLVRKPHYDQVPLDIIAPYAEMDARITYDLGVEQLRVIDTMDKEAIALNPDAPLLSSLLKTEYEFTKALYEMEKEGVQFDEDKAKESIAFCESLIEEEKGWYKRETGEDFKASTKAIAGHLETGGFDSSQFSQTDKGNICLDSDALGKIAHPIAEHVLRFKDAKSRLNFYRGFIYESDAKGRIHTSFKQCGARTGRLSSQSPNLQNVTRPSENSPNPRDCIIPDFGDCFVMLDYDQMEYRLMLDYAGQMDIIELVKGGMDVHTATAELLSIPRERAKTMNFALIYGAGPEMIGNAMGISTHEAALFIGEYFRKLPQVEAFTSRVRHVAKTRKWTYNWAGRQNHYFYNGNPPNTHAAVNHLIQGSGADVMRKGLIKCREILNGTKSSIRLTIHDELIFNMNEKDFNLIPDLKTAMETAYSHRYLPLTVSVSHSWDSWGEKVKGFPNANSCKADY